MSTTKIVLLLIALFCFSNCHSTKSLQEKEEEGFLQIEDSQIHYKISGKGKPVLLLHGGFLSLESWDSQIKALNAAGFQTIRYSELGHGKTKRGKVDLKGEDIIDAFVEQKCKGQKVSLIGLSWGGVLSTDYTLNQPDKVDKLILVSSGINGWDWSTYPETKKRHDILRAAIKANDSMRMAQLFYNDYIIGPNRTEEEVDLQVRTKLKAMITNRMNNHWKEPLSRLDTIPATNRLAEIKASTLVITGEKDSEDLFMIAKLYESEIKGASSVTIKDAGHSVNVEQPAAFNEVVIDFLKQ